MSPEDYQRASELFHEVFELEAGERARILRERAPAAEVLAEVKFMLGAADLDGFAEEDLGSANHLLLAATETETGWPDIGPYRVVGRIGEGAMGVVFQAEQQTPRRSVAIKVLRGAALGLADTRRFQREAELLGRLQHPGVAQIYESATLPSDQGGGTYIAMEFVDGKSIVDYVQWQRLDVLGRVRLLVELIHAVHHAHLRGVLHRDLKPSNVLVTNDGQIKVIDFGVARPLDADHDLTQPTQTGQVIGTLAYMSPEQVRGDISRIDARTDVYSLGVMAYELLGERLPHAMHEVTLTEVARLINDVDPVRLGTVAPGCRGDLELIVAKAMAKEPERRYQSAAALADDLERHLNYQPIEARPTSVAYQVRRFARRHRAIVGGALATLLAIVLGAAVAVKFAIENGELAAKERVARQQADQNAIEIVRRADPGRLLIAEQRAAELWPALPEIVPSMDRWLRMYGEPLRDNLPMHDEFLEELRAQALPYGEAERERDRKTHPLLAEIATLRAEMEGAQQKLDGTASAVPKLIGKSAERARSVIAACAEGIAELEIKAAKRHTWEFTDPEQQEQYDYMAKLVADLRAFLDSSDGLHASVLSRRERAMTITRQTISGDDAIAAWREVIADIRALPVYRGLELQPQIGMLPLRRDPRSGLWEFWHVASGERPQPNSDPAANNPWVLRPATGLILVLLPGGRANVGQQSEDADGPNYCAAAGHGEGPVREIEFAPLFVSKFELTLSQWFGATKNNPNTYSVEFRFFGKPPQPEPVTANTWWNPVESVSCDEVIDVLRQLDLSLPRVDEWEYAARAGTDDWWWPGDTVASLQGTGNLADGAVQKLGGPFEWRYEAELSDFWVAHAPAGTFKPNPFGLHDTIGNVWEWCADEPQVGYGIACGGSFQSPAAYAKVTIRNFRARDTRMQDIGVRPVRRIR